MEETLAKMVTDVVNQEREYSQAVVPALILHEFVAHAPKIIEDFFRIHMQNTILNVHPTTILASSGSYKNDDFRKRDHDEHQGDDAPPEGEKM
ncbi:hypothetical protein Tco_1348296 [Tanacetum coccineum]